MRTSEARYLQDCCRQIESRLGWGPSEEWSTADFETLSERIAESTGRTLGATTLKRVWGRVRYDSSPSRHTLDTLAQFVGAASWRDFQRTPLRSANEPARDTPVAPAANQRRTVGWVGSAVFVLVVLIWLWNDSRDLVADPTQVNVSFSGRKVSEGLPNSVVFDYQLGGVQADSFFIQQSWDPRLRDRIDPERTQFTSIYYYPGVFLAKLKANDTILREHQLVVPTSGWDVLIERDEAAPIYAEAIPIDAAGGLHLDDDWVHANVPDLPNGERGMDVYLVGGFEPVPSRELVFRTRIRMEVDPAFAACKSSVLTLMGTDGRVAVPLALPGCASRLSLTAGDRQVSGQTTDLSALGVDLAGWTDVVIAIKDRLVFVEINGSPVFQTAYTSELGSIVGVRYRFGGNGLIREASLEDASGVNVLPPFNG